MESSEEDDDFPSIESITPQSKVDSLYQSRTEKIYLLMETYDARVTMLIRSQSPAPSNSMALPMSPNTSNPKQLEACFRGRKLQGASISVPDGYSGFVLGTKSLGKRNLSDNSDGSSDCWEMNAKYKSITYWNHDSLPSQDDAFLRCFHWLSVAKSMHKPATAEDLVSASAALEKMNR